MNTVSPSPHGDVAILDAHGKRGLDGLELVPAQQGAEPDVTYAGMWRAENPETADSDGARGLYCGVARRP